MNEETQFGQGRITPQWLAGFFDGEGSITAWVDRRDGRNQVFMRVTVELSQKNKLLIMAINSIYPEANMQVSISRLHGKKFTAWKLVWHGKKAIRFLSDVIPFLVCKRDRAELALQFCGLITKRKRNNFVPADVLAKRNALATEILRINGTFKSYEIDTVGGSN